MRRADHWLVQTSVDIRLAENQYYNQYGRWPSAAELRNFIKYGQKTRPRRKKR